MGSRAFAAVARVVLYCAEKEPGHCVFGQEKNNLESKVPFALGYDFTKLAGYDEKRRKDITASRLVWDGREIDSVERIVLDKEGGGRARGETPAVMWLAGSHRVGELSFPTPVGCEAGRLQVLSICRFQQPAVARNFSDRPSRHGRLAANQRPAIQ
jgi:hypothetical protein